MLLKIAAVHRLTSLVTQDEITEPLRSKVQLHAMGAPEGSLIERAAYLVSCHRCVSVWAGAAVLLLGTTKVGRALITILALSEAEVLIQDALTRVEEATERE